MRAVTRRATLAGGVATLAASVGPSAATAVVAPLKQAETEDLPKWWRKLIGDVQALSDTAVPHLGAGDRYTVVRKDRLDALVRTAGLIETPLEESRIDPHLEWLARWKDLKEDYERVERQWKAGELSNVDFEDAADIPLQRRWDFLEVVAITPATTVQGAAALAEMFDLEFAEDYWDGEVRGSEGQMVTNLVTSLRAMAIKGVMPS